MKTEVVPLIYSPHPSSLFSYTCLGRFGWLTELVASGVGASLFHEELVAGLLPHAPLGLFTGIRRSKILGIAPGLSLCRIVNPMDAAMVELGLKQSLVKCLAHKALYFVGPLQLLRVLCIYLSIPFLPQMGIAREL